jgi:copper homeostasis protein
MPPNRITLEVAVTSADEAATAVAAGADRLELSAALDVGGVTPSPGAFLELRAAVPDGPTYVLLRPRPGGFVYSDRELSTLSRDADWFLSHGAAGVVVGILTPAGGIDHARCRELVCRANGKAVFHRAFDFLPDPAAALDELIDLRFQRVLTSGGAATAIDGRARLAELVHHAADRIGILPAGGITPENVAALLRATGCDQVHASLRSAAADPTLAASPAVAARMGGTTTTDPALVRRLREQADRFVTG